MSLARCAHLFRSFRHYNSPCRLGNEAQKAHRYTRGLQVGGKQEHGVNYWETYSSTLSWPPIRFILSLVIIKQWQMRQIDFTLARKTHCLLLVKNLYGQKQAGQTWQLHLRKGLIGLGFEKSKVDECVFYRGSTILLTYVDDCILAGNSNEEI